MLDRALEIHPQVALRPEPFGALAYHYGTRRLIFLRHADIVRVVRELSSHDSLEDALRSCDIDPSRWPSFDRAIESLHRSEIVHDRTPAAAR